jgi:hypothetical protein
VSAIAASSERVIVADDMFTAQLMFPLYYRRIIFLADNPERGEQLGALLARQRVAQAILVSRSERPAVKLFPYTLARTEQIGRMVLEHWQR